MSLPLKEIKKWLDESKYKIARWTPPEVLDSIIKECKDRRINSIVESGTANGWSAAYFASEGFNVWTYDPVDRPKIYKDPEFKYDLKGQIYFFNMMFEQRTKQLYKGSAVCYYIDGYHGQTAIMNDFKSLPLNKKDLIVFDDINETPVRKAVNRIGIPFKEISFFNGRRIIGIMEWTK